MPAEYAPPHLPNECLFLIVEHLHKDFYTLRTLLYVNRFFFKAAVPLLLHNPFSDWDILKGEEAAVNRKKLAALLIATAIHSQQRWLLQARPEVPPGVSAERLLALFGLQLLEPITQSPLLHHAMEAVPLMTLDYAQHLGSYLPNHVEVEEMLHPRCLLDSVESGFPLFDIHGASVDSIGPVYDKNERDMLALLRIRVAFGLVISEKRRLGTFVCKRLASLFLHCYPEPTTTIDLHACEVDPLCPSGKQAIASGHHQTESRRGSRDF